MIRTYKKTEMSPTCREVFNLLKTRPRNITLAEISEATGLEVSWLQHFSRGKSIDPSIGKIDSLRSFLIARIN
jgi:hypothetical protein